MEGIGDVNNDGKDDVLVAGVNEACVVFGSASTATVNVASLGARGYVMQGAHPEPNRATRLGDVNGDGKDDFAFAVNWVTTVFFGKATTTPVSFSDPGSGGYQVVIPH